MQGNPNPQNTFKPGRRAYNSKYGFRDMALGQTKEVEGNYISITSATRSFNKKNTDKKIIALRTDKGASLTRVK